MHKQTHNVGYTVKKMPKMIFCTVIAGTILAACFKSKVMASPYNLAFYVFICLKYAIKLNNPMSYCI